MGNTGYDVEVLNNKIVGKGVIKFFSWAPMTHNVSASDVRVNSISF